MAWQPFDMPLKGGGACPGASCPNCRYAFGYDLSSPNSSINASEGVSDLSSGRPAAWSVTQALRLSEYQPKDLTAQSVAS